MRATISVRAKIADRSDVARQLVGDYDPRRAKPVDQPFQEPSRGLRIALLLHTNVEHIPVRVEYPLEPELHAINRNDDFIQVPFVIGARPVALDAIGEMAAKPVHSVPDGFPADHHAAFDQQILNIHHAERKAMIRPDLISDDFARKTVAFRVRHRARYHHPGCLCKTGWQTSCQSRL